MSGICGKLFGYTCSSVLQKKVGLSCYLIQAASAGGYRQPVLKYPLWHLKKERAKYDEYITAENASFVKEAVHEKFGPPVVISDIPTYQLTSPLKSQPFEKGVWTPQSRRCGVVTRKLGSYPMFNKNGNIIWTTLLQVADNHVVKYIPPESVVPSRKNRKNFIKPSKLGQIIVGAECCDPQLFTREYCGLFSDAGLPPKRILGKFSVTPNAAIQPGTPLFATHFKPGDVVDVAGKTIDRGFQGVMKRWGFKGMPATHGVTKTHRRPGNIGGGGEKARVWPGKKMPGQMGNRWRVLRGLKIWRINTKYNVIFVQGLCVPGETNSFIYVYDTFLPLRRRKADDVPAFPTFFPEDCQEPLADDLYDAEVHPYDDNSIICEDSK